MSINLIYPDAFSWLSDALKDFFKSITNEYLLSLFDALREYTEYHANYCAYFSAENSKNLELYFQVNYDSSTSIATWKRMFFLSEKAKSIIFYDSFKDLDKRNKDSLFNLKFFKKESKKEGKSSELNVIMTRNNIEPAVAKEILLKKSYERSLLKKLLILKNENEKIEYQKINKTIVTFDISFLIYCGFFNVKRYHSFKDLLPRSLIIEVPVNLEFDIPKIPEKLKEEQLIDNII